MYVKIYKKLLKLKYLGKLPGKGQIFNNECIINNTWIIFGIRLGQLKCIPFQPDTILRGESISQREIIQIQI